MKIEYEVKKSELLSQIDLKDKEIIGLRKELENERMNNKLKNETNNREYSMIQENLKASKRLCELYVADNENLISKNEKLQNELELLRNEAQFLESENQRLTNDNVFWGYEIRIKIGRDE